MRSSVFIKMQELCRSNNLAQPLGLNKLKLKDSAESPCPGHPASLGVKPSLWAFLVGHITPCCIESRPLRQIWHAAGTEDLVTQKYRNQIFLLLVQRDSTLVFVLYP